MSEIMWGIDLNNSTTNYQPVKRYCRYMKNMCELATDFGYCQITACIKKENIEGAKDANNCVQKL